MDLKLTKTQRSLLKQVAADEVRYYRRDDLKHGFKMERWCMNSQSSGFKLTADCTEAGRALIQHKLIGVSDWSRSGRVKLTSTGRTVYLDILEAEDEAGTKVRSVKSAGAANRMRAKGARRTGPEPSTGT